MIIFSEDNSEYNLGAEDDYDGYYEDPSTET